MPKQRSNQIALETTVTRQQWRPPRRRQWPRCWLRLQKITFDEGQVPELLVTQHRHFDGLIEKARKLRALRTAIVAPEEPHALKGADMAAETGHH